MTATAWARSVPIPRPRRRGDLLVAAVTAVALSTTASLDQRSPGHVAGVTIRNPHEFQVNVSVADVDGRGVVPLGAVGPGTSSWVGEVVDRGDRWVFRFDYAGVEAGTLALRRSELGQAGWTLTVPADAARRLRSAGLPASSAPESDAPGRPLAS